MAEPVTRSKRKQCWDSRDMFYHCMDTNSNDDSKCKELKEKYESACPKTWRQHYENRRLTAPVRAAYKDQPEGVAIVDPEKPKK